MYLCRCSSLYLVDCPAVATKWRSSSLSSRFYFLPPRMLVALANTPALFSAAQRSGVVMHAIPYSAL